jgi:hypothetical protein
MAEPAVNGHYGYGDNVVIDSIFPAEMASDHSRAFVGGEKLNQLRQMNF